MSQLQDGKAMVNEAEAIENDIADLERRLAEAKLKQRQALQQRNSTEESELEATLGELCFVQHLPSL